MQKDKSLPPNQYLTEQFPILHHGQVPAFNPATWQFHIWGAVQESVALSWDQVLALPQIKVIMNLHCVTKWSKYNTEWEGISVKMLLENGLVKPKPEASYVMQHATGGYTTNLPLSVILQDNFLLATHYDGKPLTPEHGFPLRGVIGAIPGSEPMKDVYLWKGAKWIRGLEFMVDDRPGFWEAYGYHNEGDIWLEQRTAK